MLEFLAEYSAYQLIAIVVIAMFGAVVQSAVGFGFGMFSIPLLVFIGMPMQQAIALMLTAVLFQTFWASHQLREDIIWSEFKKAFVIRNVAMIAGILTLALMVRNLDQQGIKQVLGGVLLVVVLINWAWRPHPRERLHAYWGWLAFSLSGYMGGVFGMGGPALVLWVMAHNWTNRQSRAFLFINFFSTTPLQLIVMLVTFGKQTLWAMVLGLLLLPVVYICARWGMHIGNRISKERLKQLAYSILVIVAIHSMISPWV